MISSVIRYVFQCCAAKKQHNPIMRLVEMRMIRWMSGIILSDLIKIENIWGKLEVVLVEDKMRETR